MRKNIVIDCDPGHDDAIALLLLGNKDKFNLLGVSCAAGNQTVDKTSRNAINICEYLGIDVPIAKGAEVGLVQKSMTCPEVHGESGLDGFTFPEYKKQLDNRPGAQLIIDSVMNNEDVTVITTGAMTNLALAIRLEPKIIHRIKEIIFMGGSVDNGNVSPAAEFNILVDPEAAHIVLTSGVPIKMVGLNVIRLEPKIIHRIKEIIFMGGSVDNGNVSPAAEFNILVDPEAAHIVLTSGVPIKMVGLNVTRMVRVDELLIERMNNINNKASKLFCDLMKVFLKNQQSTFGIKAAPLHDPVTVASLIDEECVTFKPMNVEIDLSHGTSYGRTNCDVFDYLHREHNCLVAVDINQEKFWKIIEEGLRYY
ncbi:MAG: nucleoside hydrolase [Bacilli bacterium]|nr:nucleoside hydrolase [Bacilli bacterium]